MRLVLALFENQASARCAVDALMAWRISSGEAPLAQAPAPGLSDAQSRCAATGRAIQVAIEVRNEQEATRIRTALEHFHPLSVVEGFATQNPRARRATPSLS